MSEADTFAQLSKHKSQIFKGLYDSQPLLIDILLYQIRHEALKLPLNPLRRPA